MSKVLLIIDSHVEHARMLVAMLEEAGYQTECVPHVESLAVLSARAATFATVVLRATPEPSPLSERDDLGAFVLRFIDQTSSSLLARTVVLTTLPPRRRNFPPVHAVIGEPFDRVVLLGAVAAAAGAKG